LFDIKAAFYPVGLVEIPLVAGAVRRPHILPPTGVGIVADDEFAGPGVTLFGFLFQTIDGSTAEYSFTVEEEGYYRIKGGVYAPNDNDDSFYVRVDGEPSRGYLWDVRQNTTYAADYVSNRGEEDPVEVCLAAGTHTVAVYLREDGTRLDTIGLEFVRSGSCGEPPPTDVAPDECDTIRIDEIIIDPPPNGEQNVVWWPNGFGNRWNGPDEHQRVECRFNVEQKGYYRIKGRVYAPNDNDDSFWIKVNDEPSYGYLWEVLQNTAYLPDYVSDRGGEDPVEVCLTEGTHRVGVYLREDGTRMDLDAFRLEFARSDSCF